MHSRKTKSRNPSSTKVVIKEEKKDLHPMTHYIDDRVELVKQIFATLKPKTIKNLAPEFLKGSTVEEIEELCLNELLGISTKRLTSIISATKCPTDTESSDSDVSKIEEHISLEEISSDSAEENTRKTNKIPGKKNRKKTDTSNSQGNVENTKEISVLELLELQARARAIRSQLALEPIAKIEVDSDDSINSNANRLDKSNKRKQITKKSIICNHRDLSMSSSINGDVASSSEHISKRIKLKRNFRKSLREDDSDQDDDSRSGLGNAFQEEKKNSLVQENEIKEQILEREKSPSPDVITILPSPETLCISDSSEEESEKKSQKEANNESTADLTNSNENNELIQIKNTAGKEENKNRGEHLKIDSEVEDGEILEKEVQEKAPASKSESDEDIKESTLNKPDCKESLQSKMPDVRLDKEMERSNNDAKDESESGENINSDEQHTLFCNEDRHNEDVISLEHEELDYEMKDNIEEDEKCPEISEQQEQQEEEKICERNDYIELHDDSSDNENESNQQKDENSQMESSSWNSRWLQSAKVTKILAASRLGNRVRDKIKKSKKAEQNIAESKPEPTCPKPRFASKFEDGSLQQYREIIERDNSEAQSTAQ